MGSTREYAERKAPSSSSRNSSDPPALNPQVTKGEGRNKEDILDDLDDVLADIDEVLAENAQEFVEAYVQKGGE